MKRYIKDSQENNKDLIVSKKRPDPNTAAIDGQRMTAEEIADEIMLEADNDEYVYNRYQKMLSDYAKKVIENGWENTSRDRVSYAATEYVTQEYKYRHSTRKQLKSFCRKFLAEYMQEDYDRYKEEFKRSL